jgi:hypothetical protein
LDTRLGMPQSRFDDAAKENILVFARNRTVVVEHATTSALKMDTVCFSETL